MPFRSTRAFHPFVPAALAGVLLAACAQPVPEAPKPPVKSNAAIVADIQAAGERDKSVINVHPLVDPGITALQDAAHNDERNGQYDAAAAKLDQALKRNPDSPDVLQDRAELAIYMGNYDAAEKLAHQSWSLGSKQGPVVRAQLADHRRNAPACERSRQVPPRQTKALGNAASPASSATKIAP